MSSNITLKSNVYINPSGKRDDVEFLTHITDYQVLKRYESHGGLIRTDAWMTSAQRQIIALGDPKCAYENGTKSWGIPIGGTDMICRCEQYDCPRYNICAKAENYQKVERDQISATPEKDKHHFTLLPLYSEWSISNEQDEQNRKEKEILEVATQDSFVIPDKKEVSDKPELTSHQEEKQTLQDTDLLVQSEALSTAIDEDRPAENSIVENVEQETIIHAPLHDRIWVNAGPGTGKTYTVIKRIRFLLEQNGDGTILILCFSRNAVQEIRTRLVAEIGKHVSHLIDDGTLIIRTFDSFASYMLEDELDASWDYDRRIEEFIRVIDRNKDELNEMFDYIIVDELQDTVGVRARMLLALMKIVDCGVLLLGDRCQAIFDWTIRNQNDMTFEKLANHLRSMRIKKYELSGNHRQDQKLDQMGQKLRFSLLNEDEQEQEQAIDQFKEWIKDNWKGYDLSGLSQILSGPSDLILCKTNGEAAYVSQELFDGALQTEHVMKQSTRHRALAAWIAKVLYGNDGQYIDQDQFMKNVALYEVDEPEEKWRILKALDGHPHAAVIHIPEVLSALTQKDSLPEECISLHKQAAIVSTVHRAKGSEAEHVYWVDSPLVFDSHIDQEGSLGDAIKAAYVAVTRAKKDIRLLRLDRKRYMKPVNDHRWIHYSFSKGGKIYCKGIAMLPEDVDYASFAQTINADEQQLVLSALVPGLPVVLFPDEQKRRFDIYCDGNMLGSTSPFFTKDLFEGFEATNRNRNWPAEIKESFIADIVTVVAPERTDVEEKYRKMGCWLGVELGGFPLIEYGNYR